MCDEQGHCSWHQQSLDCCSMEAQLNHQGCSHSASLHTWPDIHWLARDLGWAGGSHCVTSLGQEPEYAAGA